MSERKVPTEAGWWWRDYDGDAECVLVLPRETAIPRRRGLVIWRTGESEEIDVWVEDDGCWLCPVLTPAESDAITATVARLERERDDAAAMLVVAHAEIARLRDELIAAKRLANSLGASHD